MPAKAAAGGVEGDPMSMGAAPHPGNESAGGREAPRTSKTLLGRLGVGAKLMLLVLLPVGVLLGFTVAASAANWRTALSLRDFQDATERSFAVNGVAAALADERTAAAVAIVRPGDADLQSLHKTQAGTDAALNEATRRAGASNGTVDLRGRFDAARRQLNAARVKLAVQSPYDDSARRFR